jgi:hypothetical protein
MEIRPMTEDNRRTGRTYRMLEKAYRTTAGGQNALVIGASAVHLAELQREVLAKFHGPDARFRAGAISFPNGGKIRFAVAGKDNLRGGRLERELWDHFAVETEVAVRERKIEQLRAEIAELRSKET